MTTKRFLTLILSIPIILLLGTVGFLIMISYGWSNAPDSLDATGEGLALANIVAAGSGLIATLIARPKTVAITIFLHAAVITAMLVFAVWVVPQAKNDVLRDWRLKMNQRILKNAQLIIPCDQGYRAVLSRGVTTNIGRHLMTISLVPPDLGEPPRQLMTSTDGETGDRPFLAYKDRHLEPVLSTCRGTDADMAELVSRLKAWNPTL